MALNSGLFEEREDGVYELDPVTEKYYKVGDKDLLTPSQKAELAAKKDAAIKSWEENRENNLVRKASEHERFEKERQRYRENEAKKFEEERRKAIENEEKREALKKRRAAIEAARERYSKKSFLYRLTHKTLSKQVEGKTIEEIESMYTGRSK